MNRHQASTRLLQLRLEKLLRDLGNEYSVIISSHNLSEIEDICSDIAILNKGKLVIHSSLSELKRSGQCFSLMLEAPCDVHLSELLKEISGDKQNRE